MTQTVIIFSLVSLLTVVGSVGWLNRVRIKGWLMTRRELAVERKKANDAMLECRSFYRVILARVSNCQCKEALSLVESADLYLCYAQRVEPTVAACSCSARGFIGIAMSELKRAVKIIDANERTKSSLSI